MGILERYRERADCSDLNTKVEKSLKVLDFIINNNYSDHSCHCCISLPSKVGKFGCFHSNYSLIIYYNTKRPPHVF